MRCRARKIARLSAGYPLTVVQKRQHLSGTRCAQTLILQTPFWWGCFQRPIKTPRQSLPRFLVADTRDEAEIEAFRDNVEPTWTTRRPATHAYHRRARRMVFPIVSPSAGLGSSDRRTQSSKTGISRRLQSKPACRMTRTISGAHQLCSGLPV